jgi:hypothetical protein
MLKLPNTFHEFNVQVHSMVSTLHDEAEGGSPEKAGFIARQLQAYVSDVAREMPRFLNGMNVMEYLRKVTSNV